MKRNPMELQLPRSLRELALLSVITALAPVAVAAEPYRTVEVHEGGRVSGRVTLVGTPHAPKQRVPAKRPPACGPVVNETLLVAKDGGVANAIVYLRGVTAGKTMAAGRAVLEESQCRYSPHLQAVPVGTALTIANHDPMLHCAHGLVEGSTVFNYGRPAKNRPMVKLLAKPGFTSIHCELHPWMTSVVAVMANPYFAVTGPDGAFAIDDIPPGRYTLAVWHEALGELSSALTVPPGGALRQNLVFNPKSPLYLR